MSGASRTVLIVEDNPDHALLIRLAVQRTDPTLDVCGVVDGAEAVAYLAGQPPFHERASHPFPDLVILDLIMPRLDGFGVLSWIRDKPRLNGVPVVVLTSSSSVADEERALSSGARAFHTKPADVEALGRRVSEIVDRWLG